jgi:hypothetical protein
MWRTGGEVVRDQQVGHAVLRLDVLQEVHHLGADRDVERRHRLVEHDQPRPRGERRRQRDALALAAAELVRILLRLLGTQARPGSSSSRTRASMSARSQP